MTGLPVIETKANDISAYIPTNVISITDGQLFLESDLFNANVRPAINVGVSVSRVGGSAQTKAMRKVSGSLRVDLAQFRALEAFAMFASDLDAASRAQLPQYSPYAMEDQAVAIWIGTSGQLDEIPTSDVHRFEQEFLEHLRRHTPILDTIRETKLVEDDTEAALVAAVGEFKKGFTTGDGKSLGALGKEAAAQAMEEKEIGQEQIVKQKRR